MKTNITKTIGFLAIGIIASFTSCNKDNEITRHDNTGNQTRTIAIEDEYCGEMTTVTLWAGNTPQTNVGTVEVYNNEEYLFVEFTVALPWQLMETHLDISLIPQSKRGAPGQYNSNMYLVSSDDSSALYKIPLTYEPGTVVYILAHAAVFNTVTFADETAYGGEYQGKKPWFNMITFTIQECIPDPEPDCYSETAWADGTRYVLQGNWATYTTYTGEYKEVILYAGQTMAAGTVEFSTPDNGFITITVNLSAGWYFQEVEENVKIQDYFEAPTGNPSPGLFEHKGTASGETFTITLPENNFYGVHVDVKFCQRMSV